jgi:hypothetical protein
MLYSEIIPVCPQNHTKHINTLFRQYVPRCKLIASVIKTCQLMLYSKYSLFILRSTQITEMPCVDRSCRAVNTLILVYKIQSLNVLKWDNGS